MLLAPSHASRTAHGLVLFVVVRHGMPHRHLAFDALDTCPTCPTRSRCCCSCEAPAHPSSHSLGSGQEGIRFAVVIGLSRYSGSRRGGGRRPWDYLRPPSRRTRFRPRVMGITHPHGRVSYRPLAWEYRLRAPRPLAPAIVGGRLRFSLESHVLPNRSSRSLLDAGQARWWPHSVRQVHAGARREIAPKGRKVPAFRPTRREMTRGSE